MKVAVTQICSTDNIERNGTVCAKAIQAAGKAKAKVNFYLAFIIYLTLIVIIWFSKVNVMGWLMSWIYIIGLKSIFEINTFTIIHCHWDIVTSKAVFLPEACDFIIDDSNAMPSMLRSQEHKDFMKKVQNAAKEYNIWAFVGVHTQVRQTKAIQSFNFFIDNQEKHHLTANSLYFAFILHIFHLLNNHKGKFGRLL